MKYMPCAVRTTYWGASLSLSNRTPNVCGWLLWKATCNIGHTRHTEGSEDSEEATIRAT